MTRKWLFVAAAVALVSVAAAAVAFATTRTAATSATPGRSVEGIKVEGQWKFVVKNPDGRVVLIRRFHNDPTNASSAIATILARAYTPSYWWVTLGSTTSSPGPACVSSGTPVLCRLIDNNDLGAFTSAPNSFKTLTTSQSGVQTSITLNGSMTAQRDGEVNQVSTNLSVCDRTVAPATACGTSSFWPFTSRVIGTPVSLVTGQQLLVTVTLTFT
jgi:hypothetical protein